MISVNLFQAVIALLNSRKCKILTYAELTMSQRQFEIFKTLFFDELGKNGLESDLIKLLGEGNHPVKNRHGQE